MLTWFSPILLVLEFDAVGSSGQSDSVETVGWKLSGLKSSDSQEAVDLAWRYTKLFQLHNAVNVPHWLRIGYYVVLDSDANIIYQCFSGFGLH